jgi:hypothetical protein
MYFLRSNQYQIFEIPSYVSPSDTCGLTDRREDRRMEGYDVFKGRFSLFRLARLGREKEVIYFGSFFIMVYLFESVRGVRRYYMNL